MANVHERQDIRKRLEHPLATVVFVASLTTGSGFAADRLGGMIETIAIQVRKYPELTAYKVAAQGTENAVDQLTPRERVVIFPERGVHKQGVQEQLEGVYNGFDPVSKTEVATTKKLNDLQAKLDAATSPTQLEATRNELELFARELRQKQAESSNKYNQEPVVQAFNKNRLEKWLGLLGSASLAAVSLAQSVGAVDLIKLVNETRQVQRRHKLK